MSTIAGIFRNGRVELVGPIPDWADGTAVTVTQPEPTDEITGDSPEAITAWIAWYDRLLAMPKSQAAGEEMQQILDTRKAEQKAMWDVHGKRIEGLFP